MLKMSDYEKKLVDSIEDYEVLARYNAHDPVVRQQVRAMAYFFSLLSSEIDVAEIEPFIKSRERSIIADATNKGILPLGVACQHWLEVINKSTQPVTLSQGRMIEDHSGSRVWRLMQSVTVQAGEMAQVQVEQSEYREVEYVVPMTESFHRVEIPLRDDLVLVDIYIRDTQSPVNRYNITSRWMNAAQGDYAVTVTTDSHRRLYVEFGDDARVGRSAKIGDTFVFGVSESYGYVDVARLKDASLVDVLSSDEQRVSVRFKAGGLIREGANPLGVSELKALSNYPSLYDANAVFLGNFDFLVRQKFMSKAHYINVWNETIQEQNYGASWQNINRLQLAIVAKNPLEQSALQTEIQQLIGRADDLYQNRVNVMPVAEKPCQVRIIGRLASVHDLDSVKAQIKGLLIDKYGKNSLSASRWVPNGFNSQEIGTQLRNNVIAFQDRISDFSVQLPTDLNKPHEWVFMTEQSITVQLERTADSIGASWIL